MYSLSGRIHEWTWKTSIIYGYKSFGTREIRCSNNVLHKVGYIDHTFTNWDKVLFGISFIMKRDDMLLLVKAKFSLTFVFNFRLQ